MSESSPQKQYLKDLLKDYLKTIRDTLAEIKELSETTHSTPPPKIRWVHVKEICKDLENDTNQVCLLWLFGETEVELVEEHISRFFNRLQGLILLAYASSLRGGLTLQTSVVRSVLETVDNGFKLMKKLVASYGNFNEELVHSIAEFETAVCTSCSELSMTLSKNVYAIGKAINEVTESIKDVLSKIRNGILSSGEADNMSKIAQSTCVVLSEILEMLNELKRSVTGLLELDMQGALCVNSVDSLESLVKLCRDIECRSKDLGASVYPTLDRPGMRNALGEISVHIGGIQAVWEQIGPSSEDLFQACTKLKSCIEQLDGELEYASNATDELVSQGGEP